MTKIQPFRLFVFYYQNILTMSKSTHFSGQPMYGQLIDLLDKRKVLDFSRTKRRRFCIFTNKSIPTKLYYL